MVDPQLLFRKARLEAGMHVADFGCGRTGHLVFPSARAVGAQVLVYAVDIKKDVLEGIEKRAALSAIHHIQTVWANLEEMKHTAIPEKGLDVAFLVNTLFQIDHDKRRAALTEMARFLKDKARFVIVDWARRGLAFSPAEERFVSFPDIREWAREQGFAVQEEFDVGPYHRGLVLYKHD